MDVQFSLKSGLGGKHSPQYKEHLLRNFDVEVDLRRKQYEEWLEEYLSAFRRRAEQHIVRIPRLVRDVTLRDFAKYNGNIHECLTSLQMGNLGGAAMTIDKSTRKRKWIESQESEVGRDSKAARIATASPKKTGPSNLSQNSRLQTKTPTTAKLVKRPPLREPSPSPQKPRHGGANTIAFPRAGVSRPASPVKPTASPSKFGRPGSPSKPRIQTRVPSTSTFNPALPESSKMRWPRKDEPMVSVNGSPLANPYQLGFSFNFADWLADKDDGGDEGSSSGHDRKRTNSILIRSLSGPSHPSNHTRAESQTTNTSLTSSDHSRTNSNQSGFVPVRKTPPRTHPRPAAIVAVPTKDGHILEFDPLQTSPEEIDALEGITEGAKKQAKEDIARLVLKAVERWKMP